MIYYRPHYDSNLEKEMQELRTFQTIKEMIDFQIEDYNSKYRAKINEHDVSFRLFSYTPNPITKWETTYILEIHDMPFAWFSDDVKK